MFASSSELSLISFFFDYLRSFLANFCSLFLASNASKSLRLFGLRPLLLGASGCGGTLTGDIRGEWCFLSSTRNRLSFSFDSGLRCLLGFFKRIDLPAANPGRGPSFFKALFLLLILSSFLDLSFWRVRFYWGRGPARRWMLWKSLRAWSPLVTTGKVFLATSVSY